MVLESLGDAFSALVLAGGPLLGCAVVVGVLVAGLRVFLGLGDEPVGLALRAATVVACAALAGGHLATPVVEFARDTWGRLGDVGTNAAGWTDTAAP